MITSGVFATPLFILQSNVTCVKLCMVLTKEPIRVVLNSYRKIQTYYFCFYALLKVGVATTPPWRIYLTLPYNVRVQRSVSFLGLLDTARVQRSVSFLAQLDSFRV